MLPLSLLAMFGGPEILMILAALLLLFGATKLPMLARAMGSSINQFKKGLREDPEELAEENPSDQEKASE